MKLFIITYITIVALAAFSNAQGTTPNNPDLPPFKYLLTQEPEGTRVQICELNKGFCQTNCGGPNNAPMNFCNSTTMGWGCGCGNKVPDLLGYEWPINNQHCVRSGQACIGACADPSIATENKPKCNNACTQEYTQKCGTPSQPAAYYNVTDISAIPTYGPPDNTTTSAGGATGGNATTSAGSSNSTDSDTKKSIASSLKLGNAAFALMIIVSGIPLL